MTFKPNWFSLAENGKMEAALDCLFDEIEIMCINEEFEALDDLILDCPISPPTIAIGLLTMTLAAKPYLKNREALYNRIEEYFKKVCPDRIEGLLIGLK